MAREALLWPCGERRTHVDSYGQVVEACCRHTPARSTGAFDDEHTTLIICNALHFLKEMFVERVTSVDVVGHVGEVCRLHMPDILAGTFDDARSTLIIGDALKFLKETENTFDIIGNSYWKVVDALENMEEFMHLSGVQLEIVDDGDATNLSRNYATIGDTEFRNVIFLYVGGEGGGV